MAKLTDDQIRFIIDLDANGAQGAINTLEESIRKLEQENQEYVNSNRETQKEIAKMEKAMDKLAKAGLTGTTRYNELSAALKNSKQNVADHERQIRKNNTTITANREAISKQISSLKLSDMTMRQLRDRARQLQRQLDITSASASPKAYKKLKDALDETKSAMGEMTKKQKDANSVMIMAQGAVRGFIRTKILSQLASAVKQAFNVIVDFEKENAVLASVLGTTQEGVKVLTNDAKRLGATTAYTASQITQLQTELAKLGFSQDEILKSTESVQRFATATGATLPDAAKLAGAALRSFGLDASEMERVVSTMGVATTKSALDFSYLQSSMSTVAPVAKSFGFTIEDTTALLGTLANSGFDASSAASATRNILLNLANANGKLAKRLGEPIKSMDDLIPALRKLQESGVDLAEALEMTDKRSVAAFSTFLSGTNTLEELRNSITDVSDNLKAMEEERLKTVSGSIALMRSAWEGLLLSFGASKGIFKVVIDGLTDIINKANEWVSGGIKPIEADLISDEYREQWEDFKKLGVDAAKERDAELSKSERTAAESWAEQWQRAYEKEDEEQMQYYKLQIAKLDVYRRERKAHIDQLIKDEEARQKQAKEEQSKQEESARKQREAMAEEAAKEAEKQRKEKYKKELDALNKSLSDQMLADSKALRDGDLTQKEFEEEAKRHKEEHYNALIALAKKYGEDTTAVEQKLVDLQIKDQQDANKQIIEAAKKARAESLNTIKLNEQEELRLLEQKRNLGIISETQYYVQRQKIAETYAEARLGVEVIYAEAVKNVDAKVAEAAQKAVDKATAALDQALQDRLAKAREYTSELRDIFAETAAACGDTLGGQLMGNMANAMDAIGKFQEQLATGSMSMGEKIAAGVQMVGQVASQALQAASQITQQIFEMEANKLEAAKQKELAAVGDNAEAKERIEQEYAQKELDLKKREADANAGIQSAQLWVNTAMGIATAWATSMELGPIAGPIMAGFLTAALLATAGIQQQNIIAQRDAIKNQTLEGSGSSSSGINSGSASVTTTLRPEYQEGGQGYSDGGYTGNGGVHEPAGIVHRGEYVVSHAELKNPAVVPMVRAIESARQSRKHGHSMRGHGFVDGGYTNDIAGGSSDEFIAVVRDLADQVEEIKKTPLQAELNYYQFKDVEKKMDKLQKKGKL